MSRFLALLLLGLSTPAWAYEALPSLSTMPWPASLSGSTPTNAMEINVGNMPTSTEIPAAVLQGLSVKVAVPATFTEQPFPATAISGYITNGNTASSSSTVVALFGFAGQTTGAGSPGTPFGMNVAVANCPTMGCAFGTGLANGNLVGAEIDVDERKIGSTTPIGQIVGLYLAGSSEAVPSNGAYGIIVKPMGAGVPWTIGFQTNDGAASTAMLIGASAASGAANSQVLNWKANNGSSTLFEEAFLDQGSGYLQFLGSPDAGGIVALNVQARNTIKIGPVGSGTTVLTSSSGGNTALYGDLGVADIILTDTSTLNLYRNASHVFQNVGGSVSYMSLSTLGMLLQSRTVASLAGNCTAGNKGYVALATDLNAPTYGGIAAGGGTSVRLVACDGTNWRS